MRQLSSKRVDGWGGRRPRAGRKKQTDLVSHGPRPEVSTRHPMHIVWKLLPTAAELRQPEVHEIFLASLAHANAKGLEVNHYALIDNHLHLIGEAPDNAHFERGAKSLAISFAKKLHKLTGTKGQVFMGRHFMRPLKTPTENRNALRHVLLNMSNHLGVFAYLDFFSSAKYFTEWDKLVDLKREPYLREKLRENPPVPRPPELPAPKSWLGRLGWQLGKGRLDGLVPS